MKHDLMYRRIRLVSILILMSAGLRLLLLVLHDPVLGYANQYDMARLSACLDLWPMGVNQPEKATPDAPLRHYSISSVPSAACHISSEVVLAGALVHAIHLLTGLSQYDIRAVGLSKALFLIAAILFFAWKLRRRVYAHFIHAVAVLLLLSDPINSLYLNTLYTEFSAVFGAYLAVTSLFILLLNARVDSGLLVVHVLGLLFLALSKNQHFILPWLLFGALILGARRFIRPALLAGIVVVLMVGTAAQWSLMRGQHESLAKANIYNTLFLTVLPSIENAGGTVENLGLREDCKRLINTSWYRLRGHHPEPECPEAFDVGRLNLIGWTLSRPVVAFDVFLRSVYQSSAWRVGYLGEIEGEAAGKVGAHLGVAYFSLADVIHALPYSLYFAFLAFPILYALCARLLRPTKVVEDSNVQIVVLYMLWVCVLSFLSIWFVAVLGDGYSDLAGC